MSKILHALILLFSVCLVLVGCDKSDKQQVKQQQTIVIEAKPSSTPLYFSGIIQPIKITNATSPVNGTVEEVLFSYGQEIKKGQLLVKLKSTELDKEYADALSNFLTNKEKYANAKAKMIGTRDLHKAKIISDNELTQEESSLHDSYLTFVQARYRLQKVLEKTSLSAKELELLNLGDEAAVEKALTQRITDIVVKAELDGIALKPPKGSGNSEEAIKEIKEGSEVKSGQVLVSLGDMTGLSVELNVNEININDIHPGLKATVTGNGFPHTLDGYVKSTSFQASSEAGGGLPTFQVNVIVPNLTKEQKKLINVGMSAKVQITIEHPPRILIPIKAVLQKNDEVHVMVKDKQSGQLKSIKIVTGSTTADSVTVTQGLQPGDEIVINH